MFNFSPDGKFTDGLGGCAQMYSDAVFVCVCVCVVGKRYNAVDVSAALCMSLGLIWFTLADSKVAPNFNVTGKAECSLLMCGCDWWTVV